MPVRVPVSYTHLDVYKRQAAGRVVLPQPDRQLCVQGIVLRLLPGVAVGLAQSGIHLRTQQVRVQGIKGRRGQQRLVILYLVNLPLDKEYFVRKVIIPLGVFALTSQP